MIRLELVKENNDGSADYIFDYDAEFESFYKKQTGAKVVRKQNVGKFILRLLEEATHTTPNKKK